MTTLEVKHTPTPYHQHTDGFRITIGNASTRHTYLEHDRTVATVNENSLQAQADAAFIVRACNSHEELIELIETAMTYFTPEQAHQQSWYLRARFALERAKGE